MTADAAFAALGDPVRRTILLMLAGTEIAAGDVVAAVQRTTPISQPAVSQHLAALRAAGLVTVRAEGRRRVYALDAEGVSGAADWLAGLLHPSGHLDHPLDALETEVARGRRARRTSAARERRPDTATG